MKHRLFSIAAALSLLLCLACIFMWMRSGYVRDYAGEGRDRFGLSFDSTSGNVELALEREMDIATGAERRVWFWEHAAESATWDWCWPHYERGWEERDSGAVVPISDNVLLPYWLLTATTACLPAFWFWRWRQAKKAARRRRRGFQVQLATEEK